MFTFHVDAPVGVQYRLEIQRDLEKTMSKEIKAAVQEFIDWVKTAATNMSYPGVRRVPVYMPRLYKYPRKEGRTNQLRKSLSAAFRTKLEPDIFWDTPYASRVMQHGRVRTPGTTPQWPSELAQLFSLRLHNFLEKHLKGLSRYIIIHAEPDT